MRRSLLAAVALTTLLDLASGIYPSVLEEHGIASTQQRWQLVDTYEPRVYCVRYFESALAFAVGVVAARLGLAAGAWMAFITFIASMISRVSPAATLSPTVTKVLASGLGFR